MSLWFNGGLNLQFDFGKANDPVERNGCYAMGENNGFGPEFRIPVHLPPWWELHCQVDLSIVSKPRLSEVPIFSPQRDVLWGPELAKGLAQRMLATYAADARLREVLLELSMDFSSPDFLKNPELPASEDIEAAQKLREKRNELYERKIAVHRDWLMTPREDLGGRMPRLCLHGGMDWIGRIIGGQKFRITRSDLAVPIPEEMAERPQTPMGLSEVCMYFDLCRELTARGHEVFVALRPTNEWQARLDFIPPERFLYVSIRNSFGMFSAKRIGRFIEINKIDLAHAHVARDYLAASVAVRTVKNAQLVLTRHVVFPMKPFYRFALKNVSAAIAVSPAVGVQLEKIFPPHKVHAISNGITIASDDSKDLANLGREFREFHGIPAESPLVATLGELKLLKGQRDFVLAANEVIKQVPNAHFVVAGKDNSLDRHFRRELRRLVRVFGHEESFTWLDWLDDISPLLAAADLFVSTSHSESFGLAMLDAMAAGTPVVATATDGGKQLITDENALVPIKDPIALAEKIQWFLQHDAERRLLGERQRSNARSKYGITAMIDATEALYQEILSEPPA